MYYEIRSSSHSALGRRLLSPRSNKQALWIGFPECLYLIGQYLSINFVNKYNILKPINREFLINQIFLKSFRAIYLIQRVLFW